MTGVYLRLARYICGFLSSGTHSPTHVSKFTSVIFPRYIQSDFLDDTKISTSCPCIPLDGFDGFLGASCVNARSRSPIFLQAIPKPLM